MKRIIALHSPAPRAGKTTVAQMVKQQRSSFHILSFADPVRGMLSRLLLDFGVEQREVDRLAFKAKDETIDVLLGQTYRQALIELAEGVKGRLGESFWAEALWRRIESSPGELFIIDDLRFGPELDLLLREGATIWQVEREDGAEAPDNQLAPEPAVVISNDGSLASLQIQVANALNFFDGGSLLGGDE